MRVLFVAMANSIHSIKWIRQVGDQGWDLHLFPSVDTGLVMEGLPHVTVHHSVFTPTFGDLRHSGPEQWLRVVTNPVRQLGLPVPYAKASAMARRILMTATPSYRAWQLAGLILTLRPDVIHAMNLQSGAYLVDEARAILKRLAPKFRFPPWIAANWGSDIYLFGHMPDHEAKVRSVLEHCDAYFCECQRDVQLAQQFGFKGRVLPVFPNAGGFETDQMGVLANGKPTSRRKTILIKGYQGVMGRALVALRAVALCQDLLREYEIGIYSWGEEVRVAALMLHQETGLDIRLLERAPYDQMLRRFADARVYVGLSISDAISTSLLEAMALGTFPIQSGTACADEWIESGRTGLIVPPEDPQIVAQALRRALTEDELVDHAAEENLGVVRSRLDAKRLRELAVEIYHTVLQDRRTNAG